MPQVINRTQLVYEFATQLYINKDRITAGWGAPGDDSKTGELLDFPDLDRQWYVYRDEWLALTPEQKQVWIAAAEEWLSIWEEKYPDLYPLFTQYGKPVFGSIEI